MGMEADPRSSDARLLYEGTKNDIHRIMVGAEIGSAEVVLAKILNNIDAIIAYKILNPERTIDAAKLLDLPLLSIKTPIDNLARKSIKIAKERQKIIPEYYEASKTEARVKDTAFISLGMNLLLDKIEEKGIKIVPCSGLIRVKR